MSGTLKTSLRQAIAVVAFSLASAAAPLAAADELVRCTATAHECEQQIRDMLAGKTYLGVKLAESRWGIVVTSVVADSPAALSGLRSGDRIFALNGEDASKAGISEFKSMLNRAKNGDRISFGIVRAGNVLRVNVRLEKMTREQVDKVIAAHLRSAHQGESASGGNH